MKENGGVIRRVREGILDALGKRIMRSPVGTDIINEARTRAAKEALEKTEPDMQRLAALRHRLTRRQRGNL
jgi:hypothetical protein